MRSMKSINLVEIQEFLKKWGQNDLMTMAMVLEILDKAEVIVKRERPQILLTEILKIKS